jgi:hypothetical protein
MERKMTPQKTDHQVDQKRPSHEPESLDPSTGKGRQNRQNQEGKKQQDRPLTFEEGKWETGNRQRNQQQKKPQ